MSLDTWFLTGAVAILYVMGFFCGYHCGWRECEKSGDPKTAAK